MSDKEIKNATKMEIINSEAHHRANIKFDGKPSEEVRTMMKNEGWLYSSKNNVWYPKNEAAFNSFEFAKQLQKDFFPEQKNDPEIVTEDSERQELINLISSKASLDTIISKLEELYGDKVVINATQKAVKNIENKAEIKAFCKELADKMIQTAYEASASGFNYYLSMEEVSRISGKDEAWLKAHMDNIQEALNEHWDNELLESEFDSNENSFNLNFYSIGHDANELFKKDENGRWVRKTDQELIQEGLLIKDDVFENQNPVDQIPTITKFNNIIQEAFFTLTDDDKENSITQEGKEKNYNMWYKTVCSNIMNEIQNGHTEICRLVDNFNFEDFNKNPNYSKSGKEYFVKQELLVKCHEIIQDNKRKEFDENKTPYIELNWSESPVFPFENTVYSIKEFNDIIQNADKDKRNRKDYAEKKYGSVESYWALEEAEQLPEEDKDIEFGYDKTSFKIFNLPNPENPEDTITYEPDRYDIGDGNGSIFDFIRTTCTYEIIISVMNDIEQKIYQPDISETDKKLIDSIFEKEKLNLSENLKKSMNALDEAQNNYNELHKSWIIEVNAAEKADNDLQEALNSVKETYEASIVNAYKEYYKSIELKNFSFEIPINIKKEQTLEYLSNKANQMLVTSLYSDSKKAYESGKFNWDRQRKIWELFPYNCNKKEYTDTLLESTFASIGFTVNNSVEKTPAESLTEEEIKQGKSEANRIRQENLRKKFEAEQGSNYDSNLSTTEIAKKLRNYIKEKHPDYKFSVRSEYYSGGSSISVELKKSPIEIATFETMQKYFESHSSAERYNYETQKYEKYYELLDEEKVKFINYFLKNSSSYDVDRYDDRMNYMTPEVKEVMKDVINHLESYNYDHSDSQTDYYDVNFHSSYHISDEAVKHSLELIANKSKENINTEKQNIKLNRDNFIDEKIINELHTNWILQHEAEQTNPNSVEISNNFIRIGIKPGDTVDKAIEKICNFETRGMNEVDINKTKKDAEKYFNISGYEIQANSENIEISQVLLKTISNQNEFNELVWNYGASGTKVFNEFQLSEEQKETVSLAWSEYEKNINDISEENADEIINSYYSNFNSNKAKENLNTKDVKPFNFFINDIANLDLGIGAEVEPITNLSAEEAVKKYQELITDGYRVYIGINIPGDLVFDDKEGLGAAILYKTDGKPSFYIGDNFVKELKRNDEHSQNVISAYKELYEAAAKVIPETEYPDFVFEKEKQLNGLTNSEELSEPLRVYSYSSFGFEGSIVNVETDLRRGIPAFDIIGLADGAVKKSRERVLSAFRNSNLELPSERILLSCSPADLRKDSPMDAAIATSILARQNNYTGKDVLVLGEIELSGKIRPVRGAYAAVKTAMEAGIERIVCDPETAKIIKDIDGIEILEVNDLNDIADKINNFELFKKTEVLQKNNENIVEFNEERLAEEEIKNLEQAMDGHFETVRAMEIAIAGKHNFLTTGAPGSGKTLLTQHLFPALTPKLTEKEAQITQRINSIAGLDSPNRDNSIPPFRIPHQTASIEGICGGGTHCHPGEISLAHNGTLFLDEAAEFRSAVLQMMRVPLESKSITLSRAGRTTVYPANFQLVMATNPCPCGNYGAKDKICLDSARSIEQYWKKFSGPLLDRIEIINYCEKDVNDHRKISLEQMKEAIRKAYEIQRKRGVYNRELIPDEIQKYCQLDEESKNWFEKQNQKQGEISPRTINNILKTSLTIANMEGRENIQLKDLQESYGLCIKSQDMEYPVMHNQKYVTLTQEDIDRKHGITENNVSINSESKQPELDFDDPGLNQNIISQALDEQKKILEPILNGERTGMYDCFKDFEEHGVFDIRGAKVNLGKDGKITPTGWKQLQAAMEIYRNKKFETFRYVLIDQNTGEIKDQMAISSHLPSRCRTIIDDDTRKQVISKAHNNNCIIAICHNHPSGNIEPSKYDIKATNEFDKSFRQTNGFNRFAGHIILDHNNFSLAVPNQSNPGHCRWSTKEAINQTEYDPMINQVHSSPEHDLINKVISTQKCLQNIAVMVNDTFNWNDNFIPVAFTTSNKISGIQYYSKEFFENEPEKVKEVMLKTAMENGASRTFPIITNAFTNKLSAEKQKDFENVMLNHIKNDVFSDVAIYDTTICTKHEIEPGDSYDGIYDIEADKTPDFQSTWKPEVDSSLFPPHDFVNEKTPGYELITAVKVPEKEESTIFKHDFMMQHNFYPPMIKKDQFFITWQSETDSGFVDYAQDYVHDDLHERGLFFDKKEAAEHYIERIKKENPNTCNLDVSKLTNYIIRCKQSDLVYDNDGIEKNETLNLEISEEKLAESIAAHKLFEKTKRLNFSSNSIISNPEPLLCNATVIKGKTIIASPSAEQKALIMENFPELKGNNQAIKDEYKKIAGPLAEEVFKIEPSVDYKNPDISKNQEQNQNNDFGY